MNFHPPHAPPTGILNKLPSYFDNSFVCDSISFLPENGWEVIYRSMSNLWMATQLKKENNLPQQLLIVNSPSWRNGVSWTSFLPHPWWKFKSPVSCGSCTVRHSELQSLSATVMSSPECISPSITVASHSSNPSAPPLQCSLSSVHPSTAMVPELQTEQPYGLYITSLFFLTYLRLTYYILCVWVYCLQVNLCTKYIQKRCQQRTEKA